MENQFENQQPTPGGDTAAAPGYTQPQNPTTPPRYQQMPPQYTNPYYTAPRQQPQQPQPQQPQPQQPYPQYQPAAQSQYRWVNPNVVQAQQSVRAAEETPKKKKGGFKIALAIVLAVVVAAGLGFAGGILGARLAGGEAVSADSPGQHSDQTTVYQGDRENTVIDVTTVDTGKLMTAAEVYATNVNSTVGITTSITTNYWGYTTTSAASGSGFIYTADGYIVTNYHVVQDSSAITVSLYDGSSLEAELVGYDESNDVAVLKVDANNLTPVVLGDSDNLNVGDDVVAIGNPLGELTFSLTAGTVSALNREVTFSGGITMNLIQTDCAINSGNSGGALFNLYGEVIGVTNAKYSGNSSSGATIDNIGFAIPMNHVRDIVDSIIEKGYVVRPYIGVTITDVGEESQGYGLPQGASVQGVVEGSPAQAAGLQVSDIITQIDGTVISGASDLKSYISKTEPGDVLKLTVWRKGETVELTLTVGQQTTTSQQQAEQDTQQVIPQIPGFPFPGWN